MNERHPPAISVVMPLYNKGEYVEQAVASVLASGSHILEVVVIDDGSSDDGPDRVRRMADPRIRLICQANGGVSAARNRGIGEARGDFIAFLDADDYWTPEYIPRIVDLIGTYPNCGMYATGYFSFDENGHKEMPSEHMLRSGGKAQLVARFFEMWARGNIFFTCSVVIPKKVFFEYGIFFPVNESLGEDQDVWFRIAEQLPVSYCPRPLVAYRVGAFPSLSKAETANELPPFVRRLKERYDARQIPAHHRKGVSRLLGMHQLTLASKFLKMSSWTRTVSLLFDRLSIQAPRFWLKIFLIAVLPKPIRLRMLEKH